VGGSGFIAPNYGEAMSSLDSPRRPVAVEDHAPHGLGGPFQVTQPNDRSVQAGVI